MKKIILFILLPLSINSLMAQPTASLSYGTFDKGQCYFQLEGGFIFRQKDEDRSGIALAAGGMHDMINGDTDPWILHFKSGYQFYSQNSGLNITPFVGASYHRIFSDLKSVDTGYYRMLYAIEIGKDWNNGRVFIGANVTGNVTFLNVGIKYKFRK